MANIKISQLTAAAAALGTQEFEVNESGSSKKVTGSQIAAFIESEVSSGPSFTGQASFDDGSAAAPSITNTGDTNTGMFFPAADTIAFSEGGVERMRIDSAGNVGIGTTSPGAKLELASGNAGLGILAATNRLRFTDNDPTLVSGQTTGAVEWYTSDTDAPGIHAYIGTLGANTGAADLTFGTGVGGSTAERMRITSTGNVGIGTSSPSTILDLSVAASAGLRIRNGIQNVTSLFYNQTDGSTLVRGATDSGNGFLVFETGVGTERLRIASAGQIGIGGANYGTSGQVLTSGGSGAAPSWESVGTAIAGLAYGAVGTYAFAGTSGTVAAATTLANPGDTVSGSSYVAVGLFNFSGTGAQGHGSALSGTWRVMGFLRNGSASTAQRVATVLMRIS